MFRDESKARDQGDERMDCYMCSEFANEEEEMEGEHGSEGKVHCSFNMDKIAEVFSCMCTEKEEIIQKINFGGLLKLPKKAPSMATRRSLMNRQFSLWLMRNVDVGSSEINLGIRGRLPMTARDVKRILGLPCKGKKIEASQPGELEKAKLIIRRYLLLKDSDVMDLTTIKNLIVRPYPKCMTHEHQRCFAVASVIYAASYFLAPKGRPAKVNNEILPYLVDYKEIGRLNWSEYVLRVLLESCSKVQNDVLLDQASLIIQGCVLVLQILYLDNLEFGEFRTKQYVLPRVADFNYDVLRSRIEMDSQRSTAEGMKYGKCELRHPFETIYTYGERYRALENEMENASANGTKHDEVEMLGEFFTYYFHNEKKNLRKQAAETLEEACSSMDSCLRNFLAAAGVWVQKKREKGGHVTGEDQINPNRGHGTNTNTVSGTHNVTTDCDDSDNVICPTPLEVLREHRSNCHDQGTGIENETIKKGRTKRMAIKSVGGARHKMIRKPTGEAQVAGKEGQLGCGGN